MNKIVKEMLGVISNLQFAITPQESYSTKDVYTVIDQFRNKLIGAYTPKLESFAQEVNGQSQASAIELEKLTKENKQLKSEKNAIEKQLQAATNALEPYKAEANKKYATDLLSGAVLAGAEMDVYDHLAEKFKDETKFGKDVDLKKQREHAKPILEELFKEKSYFKPINKPGTPPPPGSREILQRETNDNPPPPDEAKVTDYKHNIVP